jgi:hypothetical protein
MTTTALTVPSVSFAALRPGSRQIRIIEANLEGEPIQIQDLVRVKTPAGGGTKWNVEIAGNTETCDEIVGLLVAIAKQGTLWPSEDPTDQRPVVVTNDLMVGYRVSDDLGSIDPAALEKYRIGDRRYDWHALSTSPEFGYGAARGGAGKRVKESRVLAILRDGETWPILVTVGPGSLQNWMRFQKTGLASFHYECVVGLRLEKAKGKNGQPYSQIVPRMVGVISEEEGEIASRIYTDPLKRMFSAPPAGAVVEAGGDHDDE